MTEPREPAPRLLGRRAAAWCVDVAGYLLVWVCGEHLIGVWPALSAVPGILTHPHQPGAAAALAAVAWRLTLALLLSLTLTATWILGRAWTLARTGQTLGKRLAGIRVVDAATGKPARFGQCLQRTLVPQLAGAIPIPGTGFLPYLAVVRHPAGQGLHETASGTRTIRSVR